MKHPLLGKTLLFYSLAWAAITVAHAFILFYQFGFDLSYSILDSAVYNVSFWGFGLLYWYIVQYIAPENQGLTATIVNQSLALIVGVSFITYLANSLLERWSIDNELIDSFLTMALPWRIFLGVFSMGMIVLIYYLLQYTASLKQKENDELTLQSMLKAAELESLKSQLNPHFIFNSLNSISSLTLIDSEKAHDMVVKLSEFLRGSLNRENKKLHSLKEELHQMHLYLDIERIRFGDRLTVDEEFDEKCLHAQVPILILQPLYENAIKYGIYEQLDKVEIKTKTRCDEEGLWVTVSNNYDSQSKPQKGKGIGLNNVMSTLELIYGKSDLVTIKREKNIFTIELFFPQQNND